MRASFRDHRQIAHEKDQWMQMETSRNIALVARARLPLRQTYDKKACIVHANIKIRRDELVHTITAEGA